MENKSELSQLLQTWQASPPADPHFRQGVWNRISVQEGGRVRQFLRACKDWLVVSLPRPAYALGFVMLFALSGAAIAEATSQKVRQEQRTAMEERYFALIDPVAMADKTMLPRP